MILSIESFRFAREARDRVVCAPAPPPVVSRIVGVTFKNHCFFNGNINIFNFMYRGGVHEPRQSSRTGSGAPPPPPVVSRKAMY